MPLDAVDPSGEGMFASACCNVYAGPIAKFVEQALRQAGIDDRDDLGGGNALLHCLIACHIKELAPVCSKWWNIDREKPKNDPQDIANNKLGSSFAGTAAGCVKGCTDAWKTGGLTCTGKGGKTFPCPAP